MIGEKTVLSPNLDIIHQNQCGGCSAVYELLKLAPREHVATSGVPAWDWLRPQLNTVLAEYPKMSKQSPRLGAGVPSGSLTSAGMVGLRGDAFFKVCSLLEWCFIISIGVSSDHSQLRCRGFVGSH